MTSGGDSGLLKFSQKSPAEFLSPLAKMVAQKKIARSTIPESPKNGIMGVLVLIFIR